MRSESIESVESKEEFPIKTKKKSKADLKKESDSDMSVGLKGIDVNPDVTPMEGRPERQPLGVTGAIMRDYQIAGMEWVLYLYTLLLILAAFIVREWDKWDPCR